MDTVREQERRLRVFELLKNRLASLSKGQFLQLSFRPDVPDNERDYEVVAADAFGTATGLLLVLDLFDLKENRRTTFCIPDIQNIVMNEMSNEWQEKYYLECLNRPEYFKAEEIIEMKNNGLIIDEEELADAISNSSLNYRMIFRLK